MGGGEDIWSLKMRGNGIILRELADPATTYIFCQTLTHKTTKICWRFTDEFVVQQLIKVGLGC